MVLKLSHNKVSYVPFEVDRTEFHCTMLLHVVMCKQRAVWIL